MIVTPPFVAPAPKLADMWHAMVVMVVLLQLRVLVCATRLRLRKLPRMITMLVLPMGCPWCGCSSR